MENCAQIKTFLKYCVHAIESVHVKVSMQLKGLPLIHTMVDSAPNNLRKGGQSDPLEEKLFLESRGVIAKKTKELSPLAHV
jgi:hypothetical protein